jgi:hypothetical protein
MSLRKEWNLVRTHVLFYDQTSLLPYPPLTKAFLYYSTPPERPRIAGELRLRVASSNHPSSFESGYDLLKPNGQPWSLPLWVFSNRSYEILYEKLREERLVSDDLDASLSTFPSKTFRYQQGQLLYTLNDTFMVDFSKSEKTFSVITEQGMEILLLKRIFSEIRSVIRPYRGAYTNHPFSYS